MERFVQLVVAGGVVLVAALWGTRLAGRGTPLWLAAAALAAAACATVLAGVLRELDV